MIVSATLVLVVLVGGLLLYGYTASGSKAGEIGRIMFFAGLLAFLLFGKDVVLAFLKR